jgi:Cu+-exporting ATPase
MSRKCPCACIKCTCTVCKCRDSIPKQKISSVFIHLKSAVLPELVPLSHFLTSRFGGFKSIQIHKNDQNKLIYKLEFSKELAQGLSEQLTSAFLSRGLDIAFIDSDSPLIQPPALFRYYITLSGLKCKRCINKIHASLAEKFSSCVLDAQIQKTFALITIKSSSDIQEILNLIQELGYAFGTVSLVSLSTNAQSFQVEGMTCANCVKTIQSSLEKVTGVSNVMVKLDKPQVSLLHDTSIISYDAIAERIKDMGYDVLNEAVDASSSTAALEPMDTTQKTNSLLKTCILMDELKVADAVSTLKGAFNDTAGVTSISISKIPPRATIIHDGSIISPQDISHKIDTLDFIVIGIESIPYAPEEKHSKTSGSPSSTEIIVSGMTCASCVAAIEANLLKKEGISSVSVSLLTHKVNYNFLHLGIHLF